jgi:hypothetical protein
MVRIHFPPPGAVVSGGARCCGHLLGMSEQLADFLIRRLSEVLVPVADSVKGFRCDGRRRPRQPLLSTLRRSGVKRSVPPRRSGQVRAAAMPWRLRASWHRSPDRHRPGSQSDHAPREADDRRDKHARASTAKPPSSLGRQSSSHAHQPQRCYYLHCSADFSSPGDPGRAAPENPQGNQ